MPAEATDAEGQTVLMRKARHKQVAAMPFTESRHELWAMPKGKTKPVFYSGLALSLDQPHTQIPLPKDRVL